MLRHPEGRRAIFVGDLVDRGPNSLKVLELVIDSCLSGYAFCARGNHEQKLLKWLREKPITDDHGFLATRTDLEALKERESDLFCVLKDTQFLFPETDIEHMNASTQFNRGEKNF